ncbi:MAG: recombination protein NinB [Patescibacteria group bacterium]|nr:recombination protein NinB [Patescibacteria group bacterium]
MSERITLSLWNAQQGHQALQRAWEYAKPRLMAGTRLALELRPETRSSAENRLLHALIGEIAQQKEWAGKNREPETWKRLLVAAWCRVRGESVEILPALDGHGVDIVPARTSKLTRAECADLIEFVYAWGAQNSVQFAAQEQYA